MYTSHERDITSIVAAALLTLTVVACHPNAISTTITPEQEVLAAEHGWADATLKGDADLFASYMSDQWIGLTHRGAYSEKAPWTSNIRAGTTHYDALEISNLRVRFPQRNVAVVTGDFTEKGRSASGDIRVEGRYIDTWARADGRWQVVSSGFAPRPSLQPATASAPAARGVMLRPGAGTLLEICRSPGVFVNLKIDSASAGSQRLAMGTGTIAAGASNAGTHADVDEVNYFLSGDGRAFVGADTVAVEPGLTMYVPQGVRHGFISSAQQPLVFVWSIVPQGLATRFRSGGVAPGTCPPAGTRNP